ncbi:MAG: DedA family protein [Deltaproteobacteria bacterium]|nr:MAG: DedA family protein [Deltaproteobacteria bacterium]
MLERIVAAATGFIVAAISAGGYAGIVLLMAIESACIPLPSEIIMPFAGYLVYRGDLRLIAVAVAGALGCVLGSLAAYAVGAYGGRAAIERWGRWVLLSPRELELADRWFARWGRQTVFWARLLPVVRTFIALPAGVARMEVWPFSGWRRTGTSSVRSSTASTSRSPRSWPWPSSGRSGTASARSATTNQFNTGPRVVLARLRRAALLRWPRAPSLARGEAAGGSRAQGCVRERHAV